MKKLRPADLCEEKVGSQLKKMFGVPNELVAVSSLRREVARLSPHEKVLQKKVFTARKKSRPTGVYQEFNNIIRLSSHEQVSHTTLSVLVAELDLYGSSRWGEWDAAGVEESIFYIYPTTQLNEKHY